MKKVDQFKQKNTPPIKLLSKENVKEIVRLIVEHKMQYKDKQKKIEQRLRGDLVHEKERSKYIEQLISDLKKLKKRNRKNKPIVLKLLGVDKLLYETELKKIGDEKVLEQSEYLNIIKGLADGKRGQQLKKKAKEINEELDKQLNLAVGYLVLHPEVKERTANEVMDPVYTSLLPHMIALDSMYGAFHLDSVDIDILQLDKAKK